MRPEVSSWTRRVPETCGLMRPGSRTARSCRSSMARQTKPKPCASGPSWFHHPSAPQGAHPHLRGGGGLRPPPALRACHLLGPGGSPMAVERRVRSGSPEWQQGVPRARVGRPEGGVLPGGLKPIPGGGLRRRDVRGTPLPGPDVRGAHRAERSAWTMQRAKTTWLRRGAWWTASGSRRCGWWRSFGPAALLEGLPAQRPWEALRVRWPESLSPRQLGLARPVLTWDVKLLSA